MSDLLINGARLHVEQVGAGPPTVWLHGLGLNHEMFRHQLATVAQRHRVIAYDLRGMGRSEPPARRGTTHRIELHGDDLEALLDALGIRRAVLVAHALGSFVAMQFAITRWARVAALVLVNTSAWMGEPGISQALYRAAVSEWEGMEPLLDTAMSRWFVAEVHHEHPETIEFYRRMLAATPPFGYAASARAIANYDIRDRLALINCPTLVVGGARDWSTPPAHHELIADAIGARLEIVDGASHTVPEEGAEWFTELVMTFLAEHGNAAG